MVNVLGSSVRREVEVLMLREVLAGCSLVQNQVLFSCEFFNISFEGIKATHDYAALWGF